VVAKTEPAKYLAQVDVCYSALSEDLANVCTLLSAILILYYYSYLYCMFYCSVCATWFWWTL